MRKFQIFSLRLLWVGLVLIIFSSLAQAQYEDGSVVGTIRDSSGAAVLGASVTVTNTATGIQNVVTSNANGDYEVPSVRAGSYRVTASASGFATAVAENITVSVGNRQRIDLTLKPGQATTTVEVSDVALQLETDSSQRSQTITNYQSEALPLVSRNYSDLLGLVTGVRQAPTAATTSSISSLVRQARITSMDSGACSTISCWTAWTTMPTVRATRDLIIRLSPFRRTPWRSSAL